MQTAMAAETLLVNKKDAVFQLGTLKVKHPENQNKTLQFTQYSRLAVPGAVLTEGTTPSDTTISNAAVTATIDQWGAFATLTDLGVITPKHPVVEQVRGLLAYQAKDTIETQIYTAIVAGTTVQYANGRANRAAITATDYLTTIEIRKSLVTLRNNGAYELEDGKFYCFLDPYSEAALLADSDFKAQANYRGDANVNGMIAEWMGVKFFRSNIIPTIASTVTVHTTFVVGKNAFAMTTLQGLNTFYETDGGTSDPLHQRQTMGWKIGFKAAILNNNFFVRIEHA